MQEYSRETRDEARYDKYENRREVAIAGEVAGREKQYFYEESKILVGLTAKIPAKVEYALISLLIVETKWNNDNGYQYAIDHIAENSTAEYKVSDGMNKGRRRVSIDHVIAVEIGI